MSTGNGNKERPTTLKLSLFKIVITTILFIQINHLNLCFNQCTAWERGRRCLSQLSLSHSHIFSIFRAKEEATAINSTKHPLLDNVGGSVSLEMQLPKLLWLRRWTTEEIKHRINQEADTCVPRCVGQFHFQGISDCSGTNPRSLQLPPASLTSLTGWFTRCIWTAYQKYCRRIVHRMNFLDIL